MKIYTKTGDAGETALFGAGRVPKDHHRIEAVGEVDELNAQLGMVRTQLDEGADPIEIDSLLGHVQNELFDLGAELASPEPKGMQLIGSAQIETLEHAIDRWDATLPPLKTFILPGGTVAAASLHVARSVCRRAERRLTTLSRTEVLRPEALIYLNRLGDLLFVLARVANQLVGQKDIAWKKLGEE